VRTELAQTTEGVTVIVQILKHTPLWVFGLFFCLIYIGYVQSKPRSVSPARLVILPASMLCLSILGVFSSFGADVIAFSAWASALVTVIAFGIALPQLHGASYSCQSRQFAVPGSWIPLALMMCIFFTKYAVAVVRAVSINASLSPAATAAACLVCGSCSGLFFARAIRITKAARPPVGHRPAA
jgi:hypothetical protein